MPSSNAMHTWRAVFFAAALWTTLGAGLGFLDPARTFALFHGAPPVSEDLVQIYRGASGQSLLFAVGYLFAAFAPLRHAALVLLGGVGKAFYAVRLLHGITIGAGGPLALVAAVGDLAFVAAFAIFLVRAGALSRLVCACDAAPEAPEVGAASQAA